MNETQPDWKSNARMVRVYIDQCRARINNPVQRPFRFTLLQWAANKRIQALDAIREGREGNKTIELQIQLL